MATLYISEHASIMKDGGNVQIIAEPPTAEQTVSIGGTSTQSSAFGTATRVVRLHTDAICSVLFGTNPTATAAKKRMAANQTEYFSIPPGQSYKVAVITNT